METGPVAVGVDVDAPSLDLSPLLSLPSSRSQLQFQPQALSVPTSTRDSSGRDKLQGRVKLQEQVKLEQLAWLNEMARLREKAKLKEEARLRKQIALEQQARLEEEANYIPPTSAQRDRDDGDSPMRPPPDPIHGVPSPGSLPTTDAKFVALTPVQRLVDSEPMTIPQQPPPPQNMVPMPLQDHVRCIVNSDAFLSPATQAGTGSRPHVPPHGANSLGNLEEEDEEDDDFLFAQETSSTGGEDRLPLSDDDSSADENDSSVTESGPQLDNATPSDAEFARLSVVEPAPVSDGRVVRRTHRRVQPSCFACMRHDRRDCDKQSPCSNCNKENAGSTCCYPDDEYTYTIPSRFSAHTIIISSAATAANPGHRRNRPRS